MPHDIFIPTPNDATNLVVDYAAYALTHAFLSVDASGNPPPIHLPRQYQIWQDTLTQAKDLPIKLKDASNGAEQWRKCVREMPALSVTKLLDDLPNLLRARHVLIFLMHFYVHSLPASQNEPVIIPKSLAVPVLVVSQALDMPPVLTYADTTYYNYVLAAAAQGGKKEAMRVLDTFTEQGRCTMRAMQTIISILADSTPESAKRLAGALHDLASQIATMGKILDSVHEGCAPSVFYGDIRHWFVGCKGESDEGGRWIFEVGAEESKRNKLLDQNRWLRRGQSGEEGLWEAKEMAGGTAAQSSIVQALDAFLGIEKLTHEHGDDTNAEGGYRGNRVSEKGNFLTRMRDYMPLVHRRFIEALGTMATGLREAAGRDGSEGARAAYNEAVRALRDFRSVHVRVATLYIVNQQRKEGREAVVEGTGGTKLVPFLKGVRDRTGQGTLGQI
ncbi:hypothetical protein EW146_g4577 [Bondarzewia mesenterica]|uniref:Indoleamine 2,3-dioxygenase n=1 Tax=Bondarzewia mesenterica TaxID=1095465 RepID=A0A4S4LU68_9AGAM|nr:hypothetical protein EW146_g4577 [Bondarzewia mesenterica]